MDVLADPGIAASPQVAPASAARIAAALVKCEPDCEPDRRGHVRGRRHTMLDDTDINAQHHIRGAVGGLVAGVLGDRRMFGSPHKARGGPGSRPRSRNVSSKPATNPPTCAM